MSEESNIENTTCLTITDEDRNLYKRLDQFLSDKLTDLSRNFIKSLFEKGEITGSSKIELKNKRERSA